VSLGQNRGLAVFCDFNANQFEKYVQGEVTDCYQYAEGRIGHDLGQTYADFALYKIPNLSSNAAAMRRLRSEKSASATAAYAGLRAAAGLAVGRRQSKSKGHGQQFGTF